MRAPPGDPADRGGRRTPPRKLAPPDRRLLLRAALGLALVSTLLMAGMHWVRGHVALVQELGVGEPPKPFWFLAVLEVPVWFGWVLMLPALLRLNGVSGLIGRDDVRARHLLAELGALLRAVIEAGEDQEVPLGDELAILDRYVALQRARYGDRLRLAREVPREALELPVPRASRGSAGRRSSTSTASWRSSPGSTATTWWSSETATASSRRAASGAVSSGCSSAGRTADPAPPRASSSREPRESSPRRGRPRRTFVASGPLRQEANR